MTRPPSSFNDFPHRRAVSCPRCVSAMRRAPRNVLMRLFIGSKHYQCLKCNRNYLQWLFGLLIGLGSLR